MTTTRSDWPIRGVLTLVMGAALTVGTWSIYTLLTAQFGAPRPVAVLGCLMFDSAALFFALLAQRYARSPDSGLAPRLAMLATTATSSWVNWQHAALERWGTVGGVVLAAAPVLAELAFEMWHRWEHRTALRAQGRVAQALPVLGRWAWLLYGRTAFSTMRRVVGIKLAAVADEAQHAVTRADAPPHHDAPHDAPPASPAAHHLVITVQQSAAPAPLLAIPAGRTRDAAPPQADAPAALDLTGLSTADAVRAARDAHPDADAPRIAALLAAQGVTADARYVRTVISRDRKKNGGYL